MSTLLKALKRAEQERREKLQAAVPSPTAAAPTQLRLPVDAADEPVPSAAHAPHGEGGNADAPRINPLLIPKPIEPAVPARPRYGAVAALLGAATVITITANLVYRPALPDLPVVIAASSAGGARPTLETVSIPPSLLGAGPVPLQLRLDRHAEGLRLHRSDAAEAASARH